MTKYTAKDFANAKFAELGKHGLRAHKSAGDSYWQRDGIKRATNEEMADAGWVPVIPARIIHDSDVEALCADTASYERDDYLDGFIQGFQQAGGVILDDPEPTNAERIEEIIGKIGGLPGWERQLLAEGLDKAGVKAPEGNA